jgi:phage terminase large subunit GpA-like protein
VLPGQLAIDGAVAGAPPIRELGNPMAEVFDVPKQCPQCGEDMLLTWGGHWTPMRVSDDKDWFALQCGLCGACVEASEHQYEAVVAERQRTIGESDKSDKRVERHLHQKRVRGAG